MASTLRKTRWKNFHFGEVVEGVNRELDLMKSFQYQAVPRTEVTGKVWSTRWCHRRKGPKQVRARFVVRQFANSLDANFYSPTPGLEGTRVLLAMALLFGDISVAFMNTPIPEGDPVPPEGLYEHNDTVWCLKRALNGLRDASRLHEHVAAVLTSRLGFTRSEAQPTLFVDLAQLLPLPFPSPSPSSSLSPFSSPSLSSSSSSSRSRGRILVVFQKLCTKIPK